MLNSNEVIWSPVLNFLVSITTPLSTETGCNWLEIPVVVREQIFRLLVGYVWLKIVCLFPPSLLIFTFLTTIVQKTKIHIVFAIKSEQFLKLLAVVAELPGL